jgi:hypothetical protein
VEAKDYVVQKIDLMVIDYETRRSNKKLQALLTYDVLAIIAHREDFLENQNNLNETIVTKEHKKIWLFYTMIELILLNYEGDKLVHKY